MTKYSIYYSELANNYALKESAALYDVEEIRSFEAEDFIHAIKEAKEITDTIDDTHIPVMLIEPVEIPIFTVIERTLENYQRIVDGLIEFTLVPGKKGVFIICNEEGKNNRLTLNRSLTLDGELFDVIAGPMIFVGTDDEGNTISLDYSVIQEMYDLFYNPEMYIFKTKDRKISVIQCTNKIGKILKENNISNLSTI